MHTTVAQEPIKHQVDIFLALTYFFTIVSAVTRLIAYLLCYLKPDGYVGLLVTGVAPPLLTAHLLAVSVFALVGALVCGIAIGREPSSEHGVQPQHPARYYAISITAFMLMLHCGLELD